MTQHRTFRYMLGAPEPVQFYAHTPQEALEAAAQNPKVRAVIGKNGAPILGNLQILTNSEWRWVS